MLKSAATTAEDSSDSDSSQVSFLTAVSDFPENASTYTPFGSIRSINSDFQKLDADSPPDRSFQSKVTFPEGLDHSRSLSFEYLSAENNFRMSDLPNEGIESPEIKKLKKEKKGMRLSFKRKNKKSVNKSDEGSSGLDSDINTPSAPSTPVGTLERNAVPPFNSPEELSAAIPDFESPVDKARDKKKFGSFKFGKGKKSKDNDNTNDSPDVDESIAKIEEVAACLAGTEASLPKEQLETADNVPSSETQEEIVDNKPPKEQKDEPKKRLSIKDSSKEKQNNETTSKEVHNEENNNKEQDIKEVDADKNQNSKQNQENTEDANSIKDTKNETKENEAKEKSSNKKALKVLGASFKSKKSKKTENSNKENNGEDVTLSKDETTTNINDILANVPDFNGNKVMHSPLKTSSNLRLSLPSISTYSSQVHYHPSPNKNIPPCCSPIESTQSLGRSFIPNAGKKFSVNYEFKNKCPKALSPEQYAPFGTPIHSVSPPNIGSESILFKSQIPESTTTITSSVQQNEQRDQHNSKYKMDSSTATDKALYSDSKSEFLYKILVIGELGTGKTSIIKRYVHQFFCQHYRATIGVDFALKVLNWDENTTIRLQLWDIAGQERFGNMTRVYYKQAVAAFVVFDISSKKTFDAVTKWKTDLDNKVLLPDGSSIPAVLLANKCDQAKEGHEFTTEKMDEFCAEKKFAGWFYTSAKDNINIDQATKFLVAQILKNEKKGLISFESIDRERIKMEASNLPMAQKATEKCAC